MLFFIRKLFLFIVLPLFILYIGLVATLSIFGWSAPLEKADVAIILGTTVYPSGQPSNRLAARLNRGAELYQQGYAKYLIVSGGIGKEGHNESLVMQDFLIQKGIPKEHIVADDQGLNTARTARFAADWMRQQHLKSATMVSQFFHVPRSRLALQRLGLTTVYGAYPHYYEWRDFYSINRELVAVIAYFFSLTPDSKELNQDRDVNQ